jgi:hypothetical protein
MQVRSLSLCTLTMPVDGFIDRLIDEYRRGLMWLSVRPGKSERFPHSPTMQQSTYIPSLLDLQ